MSAIGSLDYRTYIHTYIHIHADRTHTHAYIHTYIHANTYIHTCRPLSSEITSLELLSNNNDLVNAP